MRETIYINQDHIKKLYKVTSLVLVFEKKNYYLLNCVIGNIWEIKSNV